MKIKKMLERIKKFKLWQKYLLVIAGLYSISVISGLILNLYDNYNPNYPFSCWGFDDFVPCTFKESIMNSLYSPFVYFTIFGLSIFLNPIEYLEGLVSVLLEPSLFELILLVMSTLFAAFYLSISVLIIKKVWKKFKKKK